MHEAVKYRGKCNEAFER